MDKATSKAVKPATLLAAAAPKKGLKTDALPAGTSTRAAAKLKPSDPSMAKFNLRNLNLVKNVDDLKYQVQVSFHQALTFSPSHSHNHCNIQQMIELVLNIMNKIDLDDHDQTKVAGFCLKEFQRNGIFTNVDSVIYHLCGNTLLIDSIDTRTANKPPSWIRQMIQRDGFNQNFRIEVDDEADQSTASAVSEAMEEIPSGNTGTPVSPSPTNAAPLPVQNLSQPQHSSTPDVPPPSDCDSCEKTTVVLNKLNELQDLFTNTMEEVEDLKHQFKSNRTEINQLKVSILTI